MVEEYIQKIYEELLKEEQNSAKRISDLQIHLKETQAMIHLLEETNDPNYESFTPRLPQPEHEDDLAELSQSFLQFSVHPLLQFELQSEQDEDSAVSLQPS